MLRLERLERPSHQDRNSNAQGGDIAANRGWRGAGSGVTHDPRQFISLQHLAHGSSTKPSTANYRLAMQIRAVSTAHNSSNGWNRKTSQDSHRHWQLGQASFRLRSGLMVPLTGSCMPPRSTQTCRGQRHLGVPGRLSTDTPDALGRTRRVASDQD